MKITDAPEIPDRVTFGQITKALAALGLDASRVKSLELPELSAARRPLVYVEFYLSLNPAVVGYAQIPIVAGEPVSATENAALIPAGNKTVRINFDGPVKP